MRFWPTGEKKRTEINAMREARMKVKPIYAIFPLMFLLLCNSGVPFGQERGVKVLILYSDRQRRELDSGKDPLKNYRTALERVAIIPVAASPETPANLDDVDGLLIPGGGDIDPSFFMKEPPKKKIRFDRSFDDFEFAVLKSAWERDMPILAICRGEQILNVFRHGTLYDDLPTEPGIVGGVEHRDEVNIKEKNHIIDIKHGTLLFDILGRPVKIVNSLHHHAVKDLGDGITVDAVAPDGIIEGVEAPGKTFCLGVQFHPERLIDRDPLFIKLFGRFHDEAGKYHRKKDAKGEMRIR
jgi:putative glutamine amidotransferase